MRKAVCIALMALGLTIAAVASAGCGNKRVQKDTTFTSDEVLDSEELWCLTATVRGHRSVFCTPSHKQCLEAAALGEERGGWANITAVGKCERRGSSKP